MRADTIVLYCYSVTHKYLVHPLPFHFEVEQEAILGNFFYCQPRLDWIDIKIFGHFLLSVFRFGVVMNVQTERYKFFVIRGVYSGIMMFGEELCVLDGLSQQVIQSCGSDWREPRNITN